MQRKDYLAEDAVGLAALVKSGAVTPKELARQALSIVEELEPSLGCMVERYDADIEALDETALPEGPLRGVPFIIKDCLLAMGGKALPNGSRLSGGYVAPADSELMKRFRQTGVVTIGQSKAPEFGYNGSTEPVIFGPTHNPWDLERSAGGSSGGTAAAVSAGYVPMAHGNDGGGSIRIPASCCGLVGLKLTRGRNSLGPDLGEALFGMSGEHVLTRTVRDSACMLDATNGPAPGEPYIIAPPMRPYSEEVTSEPAPAKIAWAVPGHWGPEPVDPEVAAAVKSAADLLASLGHELAEDCFEHDVDGLSEAISTAWVVGEAGWMKAVAQMTGVEPSPETLERVSWNIYQEGIKLNAIDCLGKVLGGFNRACRQIAPFFAAYDFLVLPTIAKQPFKLGYLNQDADMTPRQWWDHLITVLPFTPVFNVTGQPAISLPLYQSSRGLPIGIQIVGRFGDEAGLIRLAGQLERALPWKDRHPPTSAWATLG